MLSIFSGMCKNTSVLGRLASGRSAPFAAWWREGEWCSAHFWAPQPWLIESAGQAADRGFRTRAHGLVWPKPAQLDTVHGRTVGALLNGLGSLVAGTATVLG